VEEIRGPSPDGPIRGSKWRSINPVLSSTGGPTLPHHCHNRRTQPETKERGGRGGRALSEVVFRRSVLRYLNHGLIKIRRLIPSLPSSLSLALQNQMEEEEKMGRH